MLSYYERCGYEIVDRITLARRLQLSTNRVSELLRDGILQEATREPLRFAAEHNIAIYSNYKAGIVCRIDS